MVADSRASLGSCFWVLPSFVWPAFFMGTFSFSAFRDAFDSLLPLTAGEVAGRVRARGGARGVGMDLLLASHNADLVHSAAMQLAYGEGEEEFDQFSRECMRTFLTVVLGNPEAARAWAENAFRQLQLRGVASCSTTHEGFVLRLMQQKPYQMFLLTAQDDDAED